MEAYAHFRLDRQAMPCSKATMLTYEYTLGAFLRWVVREHPELLVSRTRTSWWSANTGGARLRPCQRVLFGEVPTFRTRDTVRRMETG